MARRGRKPDYGRQAAYAKLIAAGASSAQACRQVGVSKRTGKHWCNGYRIVSAGRVLELPAMVGPGTPTPTTSTSASTPKTYSPRYLCESERIRMADLRREGHSMREVAALMGRPPSTISRELNRGADTAGRYRPHEAHQRALQRRRVHRPSRLAGDDALRAYVEEQLQQRWSPEQVARSLLPPASLRSPRGGCAPRRSTRRCTALTWEA